MKRSARITRIFAMTGFVFFMFSGFAVAAQDVGYELTSGFWAKAVLQVATTPVTPITLVWQEVGSDTTASGAQVVSGYFYADPADFPYGSQYNPELFVKIYIAPDGWCNMAFNHVTVDPVVVYSAHNYTGSAQQTGTATTANRLLEHSYDLNATSTTPQATYDMSGVWTIAFSNLVNTKQTNAPTCNVGSTEPDTLTVSQSGTNFSFITEDGMYFSGTVNGNTYQFSGTWIEDEGSLTCTGTFTLNSPTSFTGSGHMRAEEGLYYCEWDQQYIGTKH